MSQLKDVVARVRSKNAGPFWITVDVFCGAPHVFETVRERLSLSRVASLYNVPEAQLKAFYLDDLSVIKLSFPRQCVQGSRFDRDMHGAQMAHLLAELELNA